MGSVYEGTIGWVLKILREAPASSPGSPHMLARCVPQLSSTLHLRVAWL